MRVFLIVIMFLSLLPSKAFSSTSELTAKGDAFFDARAEGHNGEWADSRPIEKAIKLFTDAYDSGDKSEGIYVRLLKSIYFYGTYVKLDKNRQQELFNKAIFIGEEGLRRYPKSAGISYWLSGAWGRWAEVSGIMEAAKKGVADKIKSLSEIIISVDERYEDAAGYRVLGRVHHKSPKIPLVLWWPSEKKALESLKRAVEVAPQNKTNLVFYAEALIKSGNNEEALRYLNSVVAAPVLKEKVVEDLKEQAEAIRLMQDDKAGGLK
ncbi:MAG: hypothetical protein HY756_07745 [Nitrospirae bacterium]|nr:hypothetical protein [Nitrospirota bacterium]